MNAYDIRNAMLGAFCGLALGLMFVYSVVDAPPATTPEFSLDGCVQLNVRRHYDLEEITDERMRENIRGCVAMHEATEAQRRLLNEDE